MSSYRELQLRHLGPQFFEDFCRKLFSITHGPITSLLDKRARKGRGDYGGPIYHPELAPNGWVLHVWHMTFIEDEFVDGHKLQIERSLKYAMETQKLRHWALCVSIPMDAAAREWWEEFKAAYPAIEMTLYDAKDLLSLAERPDCESLLETHFFPEPKPAPPVEPPPPPDVFDGVAKLLRAARRAPKEATHFYDGVPADWDDIFYKRDAARGITATLADFIRAIAADPGTRVPIVLLTGMSGEGKTTILMRLAATLVQSAFGDVFCYRPDAADLHAHQFARLPSGTPVLIFIDRLTRFDPAALTAFFTDLAACPSKPIVIATATSSIWGAFEWDPGDVADIRTVKLDKLSDADAYALADKLSEDPACAAERLGKLAGLNRDVIAAHFRLRSKRQLLAAMLLAKPHARFGRFITDEVAELTERCGPDVRLAIDAVCALDRLHLHLPTALLERLLPPGTDVKRDILAKTNGLLVPGTSGVKLQTRKSDVAVAMYAGMDAPGEMYQRIIAAVEGLGEERLVDRLIRETLKAGEKRLAAELKTAAAERFPDNPYYLRMQALQARSDGDSELARAIFRKGVEANPTSGSLWHAWALLERDEGNIGDEYEPEEYTARMLFRRAAEVNPNMPYTWHAWGCMEKTEQNFGDEYEPDEYTARWIFRKGAEADPSDVLLWHTWGFMERNEGSLGDFDEPDEYTARWIFRKGIEADANCTQVWDAWAMMERDEGNIGDPNQPEPYTTRWILRREAQASPKPAVFWNMWGRMEKEEENFGRAENPKECTARWIFREGVRAHPRSPSLWQTWACMERDLRNFGAAKEPDEYTARWLFRRGVTVGPTYTVLWNAWAHMEAAQGNIGDVEVPGEFTARWILRKGLDANPGCLMLLHGWAAIEQRAGNYADAKLLYLEAADCAGDPRDKSRLYYELATMVSKRGQTAEAMEYLEKSVAADPSDHISRARLGKAYHNLGRWAEAEEQFAESLELNPNDVKTVLWQSDLEDDKERSARTAEAETPA